MCDRVYMYHPFYHTRSNGLYTESSSTCHHQPDCENPHQFQQSVRESIVLNHLSTSQMHSNPYQLDEFPESKFFYPIFLLESSLDTRKSRWSLGGNFEDYIRFLSCHRFSLVNYGQTWKGWKRSGKKGLIISDNQAETGLIITVNDSSLGYLPLIINISDTCKNQT